MKPSQRSSEDVTGFLDISLNLLLMFAFLFTLTLLLVNPPVNKDADIKLKAEYIVSMEWDNKNLDDVDLFLQAPGDKIVFFSNRDQNGMSLDRDDQGGINDTIRLQDGTKKLIEENYENITIRKTVPGEYTVNVFMFNKRSKEPVEVKVKVIKLNPYRLIYSDSAVLFRKGDEATIIKFTIGDRGRIVERSTVFEPVAMKVLTEREEGL